MNNKFVAFELHGSLPHALIETVIALNSGVLTKIEVHKIFVLEWF
jgi:hypothetical protein